MLMRSLSRVCGSALMVAVAAAATEVRAQSISSVGVFSGDAFSDAVAVSSNGQVVTGESGQGVFDGCQAYRWSRHGGLRSIGLLPGATQMLAMAINGDGSVIVGDAFLSTGDRAYRWTARGGLQNLGLLPGVTVGGSAAYGVSRDGSVVVGLSSTVDDSFHAIRWTQHRGMQDLGALAGGAYSMALAVSGNGEAATGFSDSANGEHAFKWTRHGMQDLGAVQAGDFSGGQAISTNGFVVAGYSGSHAARWVGTVAQDLGTLPGGTFSTAYSLSGNGQVAGGLSDDGNGGVVAMIWTASMGMVDLNTYLPTVGVDLTGWQLRVTTGISQDGSTMVGIGTFNGEDRGWVVKLGRRHDGGNCDDDSQDDR